MKSSLSCFYLRLSGSRSGPSTADAGPTMTTQTSTTLTRGTPSSTRRQSVSTENTQQRSNKTWREAQQSSGSIHLSRHVRCLSFLSLLRSLGCIFFFSGLAAYQECWHSEMSFCNKKAVLFCLVFFHISC